jgi:DNA-binding response OmpR family regulator
MGLSAVSKPVGSDREALLGRVEARSAAWRRLVAALEGGSAGEGRALEEELRSLGREATTAELPLLAEELSACRAIVQGALVLGRFDEGARRDLDAAIDRLRRYAAEQRLVASPRGRRRAQRGTLRVAAYGSQHVVDGLVAEDWAAEDDAPTLRVERVTRVPSAKLPDVMVVDLSDDGAEAFALGWLDDSATETVPLIVVGAFDRAEESAELVARGVARILPKPVAPGVLRRACVEVGGRREAPFEPIGETNVERLGLRLASELQRGLGDAVDAKARSAAFDLAGGAEVLTVLWDAVARIRELVSAKSKGSVRFGPAGPIEALPQACWLDSGRRDKGQRAVGRDEVREGGQGRLDGRRVLVVEDDLSVNWFLAGVLQQAGAEVLSARHGREALEIAFRQPPDLVITDVVMPELDGLSLRRAIGRDVRLRSTPVIMLSWKDDLLQRMRELGVEADGYLRKQATDREIVQRSLEVLRSRRAVVDRIVDEAPVRGRLDGLTACDLLAMVCALRPDARVTLRDARHTIEIDVRGGRPVVATRTDASGHSDRGPLVIASLLGIGGGRFGVETLEPGAALNEELEGSLEEQLLEPVARVRAAERLLAGASLLRTDRVILDEARVDSLLGATPEPARGVLTTLAAGISPRELVVSGRAASELVERVLADAARQGAICAVRQGGEDVLAPAVAREIAVQSGDVEAARLSVALLAENLGREAFEDPSPEPAESARISSDDLDGVELGALVGSPSPPAPARPRPDHHTPILASATVDVDAQRQHTPTWSTAAEKEARLAELAPPRRAPSTADREDEERRRRRDRDDERRRDREEDRRRDRDDDRRRRDDDDYPEMPRMPRLPGPSAWATRSPEPPAKRTNYAWPAVFGVLGIGLAVGARYMREHQPPPALPVPITAPADAAPIIAGPADAPAAAIPTKAEEDSPPVENQPVEMPLTDEEAKKLRKGEGLLEVVVGQNDVVFVDGKKRGSGPVVKVPLAPKDDVYEVRVKMRDEERVNYVLVKAGVRTRLRVAPPWSR